MITQTIYAIFRRFSKDSLFSFINLTNLMVGFATFILLSQFISGQFSYDKYHVNYKRIYRLQLFMDQKDNKVRHSSSVTAALSRHELTKLPEIEKIALLHDVGDNNKSGVFLSVDKKNQFLTRYGYFADQTVFDIFTFIFLEGNSSDALTRPNSIVLSRSIAEKLFPEESALGKQVYGENKALLTVTGVYDDIPVRSSWRPTYLIPMLSYTALTGWEDYTENYRAYSFLTYVLLKPNADPATVDQKIFDALKDYRQEHHPYLRPMSKLYINAFFQNDLFIAMGLFSFIALLILVLSAINFVNLQTASATGRFREIGIRKTVGFSKKQLWMQFMLESMGLAVIASMLGLVLAQLCMPAFNRMIGEDLLQNVFNDGKLIAIIGILTLVTGFISGLHPAYAISAFNPVKALKQKHVQEESNGISLKKVLVTGQFSISLFLLIVSLIIFKQTRYMLSRDMGFDSQTVLFANITTNRTGSFDALRQSLIRHQEILDACQSDYIPFMLPGGGDFTWEGAQPDQKVFVRRYNISHEFIHTWGLQLTAGRNFSREFPADHEKCLINETAVRIFGWDNAIGRHVRVFEKDVEVIGVIRDFIAFSVHNPIEPAVYRLISDSVDSERVYSVRYRPGTYRKARDTVQEEFTSFFPDDAFEFKPVQVLIQHENAALAWQMLMKVSGFFAAASVVISSIGLFGLILFFTRRKMKEIGIRKVLGFSNYSLFYTLSSGFLKLLLVAALLAWPCAYYVYRILPGAHKYPISLWEFGIATLIILLIALATMSLQLIRAIKTNAAEVLKEE